MKHIPRLALALAASLSASFLFAADDWLRLPPSAPASGAPASDKPAPATPDKSAPATGANGSSGWLYNTDAPAPTGGTGETTTGAPVSGDAVAALNSMKQKDAFSKFWSSYARAFIPWGDDYVSLPTYNPLHPSSRGFSADQIKEKMTKTVTVQDLNVRKQQAIAPPYPEIQAAALTLPAMEVGQYGFIHSFKVDKILGPDEMIAREIWILDADATLKEKQAVILEAERNAKIIGDSNEALRRANTNNPNSNNANFGPNASALMSAARDEVTARYLEREKVINRQRDKTYAGPFKVKGYPTSGVIEGQRWTGPTSAVGGGAQGMQIAIVRVGELKPDKQNTSTSRFGFSDFKNRVMEITPAYAFKSGLNQEAFVTMLAKYGISPDQFIDMVVAEVKRDNDGARGRVFLLLEEARRKWEADNKAKADEARKKAEQEAKDADKAAKEAERAAKEAERKANQQRKNTR
jgi:hypothetical protein